jgi:sugar transferase (PEP-CTERM system associated)
MRVRLLGYSVPGSIAALVVIECVLLFASVYGGFHIRFAEDRSQIAAQIGEIWPRAALFAVANILSFIAFGLYSERQRAQTIGMALRVALAMLGGTTAVTVAIYLLPGLEMGRGVLAISALIALILTIIARAVFDRFADTEVFKRRVLVYGAGLHANALSGLRRRSDRRGHVIVGYVGANSEDVHVQHARVLTPKDKDLPKLCRRLEVDEVVVAMDDRRREFPIAALLECRLAGIDVTELVTFLERETGRVRVDLVNPAWMIFGGGFRRDTLRRFTSRVLDIATSLVLLTVSLPLIVVTIIAIKIEDGLKSAVFYRQPRVGYGGRVFDLLKFRSMRADAERDGQAIWAQLNDPRVTRVGLLIRKLRIDELPQILNVLAGHMSLVGPRPERPQFVEELSSKIPYYAQRHAVKPGITGWAQICYPYGSSDHDALQKLQYDLYYLKNNSFLFDLAIIIQTAEVVFMGKGAR